MNVSEDFKIIGYYIVEVIDMPEYLRNLGEKMLSVSSCLGEMHPRLESCFVNGWRKGEKQIYQKRLKLSDERYEEYVKMTRKLFKSRKIDGDCRFLDLSDAQYFWREFCMEIPCRLVSISTTPDWFGVLSEELKDGYGNSIINGEPDHNTPIGHDILGWDIGGFHSFLCNSLHKELPEARFNEIGLLKNDFAEVTGFARRIKGKGEPVEWIPCRVGEVLVNRSSEEY